MLDKTQKLYESDSYCKEFSATVLECEQNGSFYNIVLDKTAFFAEGGGQKADLGFIENIEVLDVQQKGDVIVHKTNQPIAVGEQVACKIDWGLRYSRMQSHTGEHILSGIVYSLFGFSNIGFHMSEAQMSVDFSGTLTKEDIKKIELESNLAIYKNADITAYYPTKGELETQEYRSKKEFDTDTRIVDIKDIDRCACCAPHLKKTGEVGLIKIIDFYPNKQGTRIEMLAGINALNDYITLNAQNKQLMGLLCAKRENVVLAAQEQSTALTNARSENIRLSRQLALLELNPIKINGSAYAVLENKSYEELRYCSNTLIETCKICALFSTAPDGSVMYVLSSKATDVTPIVKQLNAQFNGKGGGKPNYAQGKLTAQHIENLKATIEQLLSQNI